MKESTLRHLILLLCLALAFYACRTKQADSTQQLTAQSEPDSLNEKVSVHHAHGFTIDYFENYKVVKIINPFEKSTDTTTYLLVQRGTAIPSIAEKATVIQIPVRSLALTSSMHIGLLSYLNSEEILSGLSSLQYVFSPKVIEMIDAKKIVEIGKDQGINEEKLITMQPDLLMTTGSPGSLKEHNPLLSEAGIPVIINSEWVEKTPLGRAEWVKLMAALLNKEEIVNRKFAETEKRYENLVQLASKVTEKPVILSGLNTKDVWYMPNGNSYMAQFFKDAGSNFPWKATSDAGSAPLSFETVYPVALNADFWMNVGFDPNDTRSSVLALDKRYSDFKAFKNNRIFSYNNRVNTRGSNDFFETGNVEPDVVLADLLSIFHPELLPDHKPVYYKQLK
ncbi:ABC transporter substrate-binding protein [Dyadobacter luteus]|uniref:ABC transporter substrate-binding protein n=1 Tax=Dyadobacter luteus TaxID=2259619 RepID=A0A3D8YCY7_9BACT|nr:ABC transporter substrate-binding protein [Dyadobacter luteus]REA62312.1 ABC transporter substrate-binding protein [Dyadobacter luteus]